MRIACCASYPLLLERCCEAMRAVMPNNRVQIVKAAGYSEVAAYSKHWPCLFPQHGPGPKHSRRIELTDWQGALVEFQPWALLEGLIHSDGCRVINWVGGRPYPRYHFSNASDDIKAIFMAACRLVGVDCRPNNARNLSVARGASVALMDRHIARKA